MVVHILEQTTHNNFESMCPSVALELASVIGLVDLVKSAQYVLVDPLMVIDSMFSSKWRSIALG